MKYDRQRDLKLGGKFSEFPNPNIFSTKCGKYILFQSRTNIDSYIWINGFNTNSCLQYKEVIK